MIWKHSSSLEQTWKLRTAAVGFCASKGTGIGATSMFDNCLSLLNHLAFLSKWNCMILGNNEVNTLKVVFCSASCRKRQENWMGENQNSEWQGADIHSQCQMNKHAFNGLLCLAKICLILKRSKSLCDSSGYESLLQFQCWFWSAVFQKLVLLLPYYVNSFNGTYAWVVISLTWENVSANATCTIFGLTAELQYCLSLHLDLSSTHLGVYLAAC